MANAKHTPGPWALEVIEGDDIGYDVAIVAPDNRTVAEFGTGYELADAKLMAAAPEMLSALLAIIEEAGEGFGFPDSQGRVTGTINKMAYAARAAIAKAAGSAA